DLNDRGGDVRAVHVHGIGVDVTVVQRAGVVVGAPLPRDAVVGGAEDATLAVRGFDVRVEHVRVDGRDRDSDASELFVGQARYYFLPGFAAIGAAMDRALRTAVDHGEKLAAALIRGRDDDVGIARIDHDVADASVLRNLQHLAPRLAAIGRLVESPIPAWRPERSLCGDIHGIVVLRIDDDAS